MTKVIDIIFVKIFARIRDGIGDRKRAVYPCATSHRSRANAHKQSGLSLVELMFAMTLLAVIGIGLLQLLAYVKNSQLESRIAHIDQDQYKVIAAAAFEDFQASVLPDNVTVSTYSSANIPAEIDAGNQLLLGVILGNADRYDNVGPLCTVTGVDSTAGYVEMASDCTTVAGSDVGQNMIAALNAGVEFLFVIDRVATPCISQQAGSSLTANNLRIAVSNADCLVGAMVNDHVMMPRFVLYEATVPPLFFTSFVEPLTAAVEGSEFSVPASLVATRGANTLIPTLDIYSLSPSALCIITFTASTAGATLGISDGTGIIVTGNNSASLQLDGTVEAIRQRLSGIYYRAPTGGALTTDTISTSLRVGPSLHRTTVAVTIN